MVQKELAYLIGRIARYATVQTGSVEVSEMQDGFLDAFDGAEPDYKEVVTAVQKIAKDISKSENVDDIIDALADLAITEEDENFFTEAGEFITLISGTVKELREQKKAKRLAKKDKGKDPESTL